MKNIKKKVAVVCIGLLLATTILVVSVNEQLLVKADDGIPPLPNPFMITELKEGWNMIGYPNQGSVELVNLAIIYNDTTYTWTEAWQQEIILRFVYNWDRETQCYDFVDMIDGGEGYWMWAYFDCELWSLI